MAVIVVIDDEQRQRDIIKTILEDEGYETHSVPSAEEGLNLIKTLIPDVIITDLKMGGMSGLQLLESVMSLETMYEEKFSGAPPAVIIMTAYGTISSAVEAIKKGAFDYMTKPLDKDAIVLTVKKAVERMQLLKDNVRLQNALFGKFKMEGIVGNSMGMKTAMEITKKAAPTTVTVLILGESGTGKELIAKAIHYNSQRRTGPFTAINCAAIPDNLIESELFGYEPGAFTGAVHRKIGLFESSDRGTLFLDEVGDLPLLTQTKILRVLQDKEVRRLGGKDNFKVDVRIIAATNKDIEKEVAGGKFREDLYYRLKVVTIELPPLRDRKEDIGALAGFFIEKYNKEFGKKIRGANDVALNALLDYHWPGNIRQLEFVIERAVLMCDADILSLKDFGSELRPPTGKGMLDIDIPDDGINFEELEKELIKKAMLKANNIAAKAARLLGMTYKTFWYRLEKFGLNDPSLKED